MTDHYDEAERLLASGLISAATVHALLAIAQVLAGEPGEWPELLRPMETVEVKEELL